MKKRIKTIIGIIVGIIIGVSTTVTAGTIFNSRDITYSSSATSKTNVKDALDELYIKASKIGECPEGKFCLTYKPIQEVKIGNYISMTPTETDYNFCVLETGYSGICGHLVPSELKLWKVIKKNDDGTIDVISEYVSSNKVAFKGRTGYMNYVGILNEIASHYKNEKYVVKTRHYGYINQIETCESFSASACPGDRGWETDNGTIGTIERTNPGGIASAYWIASRYQSSTTYGVLSSKVGGTYEMRPFVVNSVEKDSTNASILPILTLKGNLQIKSGSGTKTSPYQLN